MENFQISILGGNSISVKQMDVVGREKELHLVSKPSSGIPKISGNWKGDRFMTNKQYLNISFLKLEENSEHFTCHIMCGSQNVGPLSVAIACDQFFLVSPMNGGFWVYVYENAEQLLCLKPIWAEDHSGQFLKFTSWVRFTRPK